MSENTGENKTSRVGQLNTQREIIESEKLTGDEIRQLRIQGYTDWQISLEGQVKNGRISQEEKINKISRALYARDLLIERANERSIRDPLTKLYNRGEFFRKYDQLATRGESFGMLILDADFFKNINSDYGHPGGDQALVQLALTLSSNLRQEREENKNDIIARYGGEEFAVLIPGINNEETLRAIAEKLRLSISENELTIKTNGERKNIPLTISIGGGIFRNGDNKENFIEKVDQKGLYQAKELGRNQTVIIAHE